MYIMLCPVLGCSCSLTFSPPCFLIILSFTCVIFLGWSMGVGYGIGLNLVSAIMMLFMNCLEVLVAFIQAYVFTLLSAVFIGLAQKEEEAEA